MAEEEHPETCSEASLTSPCHCSCNGTRHGEGRAAARLARHAPRIKVRTGGRDAGGAASEPRARPNMKVREAAPGPNRLRAMDDDELAAMFTRYSREENWDAFAVVDAELARREEDRTAWLAPRDATGHWYTGEGAEPTESDRRMDELLATGYDYAEAYAEVYGGDATRIRAQQRAAAVDRREGESTDAALRRAYDCDVYDRWIRAEGDTRGHLLNAAGRAAGIDPVELFSGPAARARKYASEDLLRWWAEHGRLTFTEFRAGALGRERDLVAAERTRIGSNARDFV